MKSETQLFNVYTHDTRYRIVKSDYSSHKGFATNPRFTYSSLLQGNDDEQGKTQVRGAGMVCGAGCGLLCW